MRRILFIGLLTVGCSSVWAADAIKFDVKLGLWETTNSFQTSGMPQVSLPPNALANLTPEQRAKVEAMMKDQGSGRPRTTTQKSCLTREKMDKRELFSDDRKECTRTVVSSTSSKIEMKVQCNSDGAKTNGTFRVEALNSETVKGSMQMASVSGDKTINMSSNFTSKWLGPDCGDVK